MDDLLKGVDRLSIKSSRDWTPEEQIEYKRRVEASGDETLVYDPEKDGSFKDWIGFKPSQIGMDEGIKAVRVNRRGLTKEDLNPVTDDNLMTITREFEEQKAKGDIAITKEFLDNLGLKYGFTVGKWMIITDPDNANKMWQVIANGVLNAVFPESTISARIGIFDERGARDQHVKINVYTRDFSKEREVREAELAVIEHLKRSGIPIESIQMMKYKAELYTHVNIFVNNKFDGVGIPPSMYTSKHAGRGRTRGGMRGRGGRGFGRGRRY